MTTPQPTVAPTVEQVMAQAHEYTKAVNFQYTVPEIELERAELRAMVEALAVDAERYQWLIANAEEICIPNKDGRSENLYLDPYNSSIETVKKDADAVIDAARTPATDKGD